MGYFCYFFHYLITIMKILWIWVVVKYVFNISLTCTPENAMLNARSVQILPKWKSLSGNRGI